MGQGLLAALGALASVAVAVILPLVCRRLASRWGRDEVIDGLIRPPRLRFRGVDESARRRTASTRERAGELRRRAAAMECRQEEDDAGGAA